MDDLIIQRDARDRDNGTLAWMVALDARALALSDCGCGLPVLHATVKLNAPKGSSQPAVLEAIYFHEGANRCQMSFDCANHYKPLTYGQYCKLMEIESDEEE